MILVDTSAWVDFLRGVDSAATAAVRQLISRRHDELVMCEPIAMELLVGAADAPAVARIRQPVPAKPGQALAASNVERLTDGLPWLGFEPILDFRSAAGLHRLARAGGETVRSIVDCLIAAVALRHDATLVHKDRDFEVLARVTSLRQRSYRTAD